MTRDEQQLANARYATNRLQRLAAARSSDWRADTRELASVLRSLAIDLDQASRRGGDHPPALLRRVAADVLAWHASRSDRSQALAEVFTLLDQCDDDGTRRNIEDPQLSGADLIDALKDWAARHAAYCPPGLFAAGI